MSDARNFLFFPRTGEGKRAASDYLNRLKERTDDRDKGISMQAEGGGQPSQQRQDQRDGLHPISWLATRAVGG